MVLYHDIEVAGSMGDFATPENPSKPITSIAVIDSLNAKVTVFTYRDDIVVPEGKACYMEKGSYHLDNSDIDLPMTKRIYNSERKMMKEFGRFFSYYEPDFATGWNSNGFDLPYIIRRYDRIGLRRFKSVLSPMGRVYVKEESDSYGSVEDSKKHIKKQKAKKGKYRVVIGGCNCFDLMVGHLNIKGKHEDGHSLNAVLNREIGTIEKTSEHILGEDWYETDLDRFINYNIRDTEGVLEIDKEVGVIDHHEFVVRFSGVLWEKVFERTNIVDAFYLYNSEDIAMPTKIRQPRSSYKGAIVFDPKVGLHRGKGLYQVCVDLVKEYPNCILSANMSPEMVVPREEPDDPEKMIILGNGVRFRKPVPVPEGETYDPNTMVWIGEEGHKRVLFYKETVGFIPRILSKMFMMRTIIERKLKKAKYGSKEWIDLNAKKFNAKITINSVYGWLAYPGGRFYHPDIARSITWLGRKVIMWTSKVAGKLEFETLYGDTDSIFVETEAESLEECISKMERLVGRIEKSYDRFASRYYIDHHFFALELEKIFSFMYFFAKKRYVGNLIWLDGQIIKRKDGSDKNGQLLYKGVEMKRSDSAWITKQVQRKVFTMLGDGEPTHEIREYLQGVVDKFTGEKYDLMKIGIPKGLQQEFYEYETDSPWLRGSIYSNDNLGTNFGKGSKPKVIYIKKVRGTVYPPTDCVCIDFDHPTIPGDFVVDWEKMAEKTVRNKVDDIMDALDIDWDVLVTGIQSQRMDTWLV